MMSSALERQPPAPSVLRKGLWVVITDADERMQRNGFGNGLVVQILNHRSALTSPSHLSPETVDNMQISIGKKAVRQKVVEVISTPPEGIRMLNHKYIGLKKGGAAPPAAVGPGYEVYLLEDFKWTQGREQMSLSKGTSASVTHGPITIKGTKISPRRFNPAEAYYVIKAVKTEDEVWIEEYDQWIRANQAGSSAVVEPRDPKSGKTSR